VSSPTGLSVTGFESQAAAETALARTTVAHVLEYEEAGSFESRPVAKFAVMAVVVPAKVDLNARARGLAAWSGGRRAKSA